MWHYIKAGRCVSINKQVSVISGSFYVPADFDTIGKAFSGVEIPKKGIKHGLSGSIADFGSPFSLYSIKVKPLGSTGWNAPCGVWIWE